VRGRSLSTRKSKRFSVQKIRRLKTNFRASEKRVPFKPRTLVRGGKVVFLISPPKNYSGKCRHNNFKRTRKIANYESNKNIYRRRVIVECVFSSLKRKQNLKLRSRLSYMKKREMGWHILFYNILRNIDFGGVQFKEDLTFFILIFEFW